MAGWATRDKGRYADHVRIRQLVLNSHAHIPFLARYGGAILFNSLCDLPNSTTTRVDDEIKAKMEIAFSARLFLVNPKGTRGTRVTVLSAVSNRNLLSLSNPFLGGTTRIRMVD